jgi:hypothetical protein
LIVQEDEDGKRKVLTLAGTFTNSCLYIDKILIARTRPGLIEVLPMLPKEEDIPKVGCEEEDTPFIVHQVIPNQEGERRITNGRYLFHVRTMNGGSFNKIDYIVVDKAS